jgi:hypothetical protein
MTHDDQPRSASAPLSPLPAAQALDTWFLEARSKLLDLAAIFDRVDRGGGVQDPRLTRLRRALQILGDDAVGRAERLQRLFSLEYDASWERPQPRS